MQVSNFPGALGHISVLKKYLVTFVFSDSGHILAKFSTWPHANDWPYIRSLLLQDKEVISLKEGKLPGLIEGHLWDLTVAPVIIFGRFLKWTKLDLTNFNNWTYLHSLCNIGTRLNLERLVIPVLSTPPGKALHVFIKTFLVLNGRDFGRGIWSGYVHPI